MSYPNARRRRPFDNRQPRIVILDKPTESLKFLHPSRLFHQRSSHSLRICSQAKSDQSRRKGQKNKSSNMIALSIHIFIPILISLAATIKLNVVECDQQVRAIVVDGQSEAQQVGVLDGARGSNHKVHSADDKQHSQAARNRRNDDNYFESPASTSLQTDDFAGSITPTSSEETAASLVGVDDRQVAATAEQQQDDGNSSSYLGFNSNNNEDQKSGTDRLDSAPALNSSSDDSSVTDPPQSGWQSMSAAHTSGKSSADWWTPNGAGGMKPTTVVGGQEAESSSELVGEHNYLQFGLDQPEAADGDYLRATTKPSADSPDRAAVARKFEDAPPSPTPGSEPDFAGPWNSVAAADDESSSKQLKPSDATSSLLPQAAPHDSPNPFQFDGLVPIVGPVVRAQASGFVASNGQISVSATRAPKTWVEYLNNQKQSNSTPYLVAPATSSSATSAFVTASTTTYAPTITMSPSVTPTRKPPAEIHESWGRRKPKGEAESKISPQTTTTPTSKQPQTMDASQAVPTTSAAPALIAASSSTYEDIITWTPAAGPAAYRAAQANGLAERPLAELTSSTLPTTHQPSRAVSPFAAQQDNLQQLKMQLLQRHAIKDKQQDYEANESGVQSHKIEATRFNPFATRRPPVDEDDDDNVYTSLPSIDRQSIEPTRSSSSDDDDSDPDDIITESSSTETPSISTTRRTPTARPKAVKFSDFGRELNQLGGDFMPEDELRREVAKDPMKKDQTTGPARKQHAVVKQADVARAVALPTREPAWQPSPQTVQSIQSTTSRPREPTIITAGPSLRVELASNSKQVQQSVRNLNTQQVPLHSNRKVFGGQQQFPPLQPNPNRPHNYSPMLAPSSQRQFQANHPVWSITAFPYQQPAMNYGFTLLQQQQRQQAPPISVAPTNMVQVMKSAPQASNWSSAAETVVTSKSFSKPSQTWATNQQTGTNKTADTQQKNSRGDLVAQNKQQPITTYTANAHKPPLTLNLRTSQALAAGPNQLFWEAAARAAQQHHNKMYLEPGKMPLSNAHLPPRHRQMDLVY